MNDAGAKGAGGRSRRRTAARLAAVQALYQIELGGATAETVRREFLSHRLGKSIDGETYGKPDDAWFSEILKGASARQADIDALLTSALTAEWPLSRLEAVLRALLRAAAWELLERQDVPARVVVSEYVDIAHAFFTGREPALANGVLDRLAHRLRPDEFTGSEAKT